MTSGTDDRRGIGILADDLTSAGDGAAPFRRTGHGARIILSATGTVPRRTLARPRRVAPA